MFNNRKNNFFRKDFANPNPFNSNNSHETKEQVKDKTFENAQRFNDKTKDKNDKMKLDSQPSNSKDNGDSAAKSEIVGKMAGLAITAVPDGTPTAIGTGSDEGIATCTTVATMDNAADGATGQTEEVVNDGENCMHQLQNSWTLWYLENDRTKSWEEMQNEITTFDTVEDFWKLYSHIKSPSDLKAGCDYSLFKKGIRPMWEDTANKEGGRWVITLNKNSKSDLDNLWLDVMLCLIGETFEHTDEICGAVVNIRSKNNKISIWTANGGNEKAVLEIGYKLRDTLHLGYQNLQYQLHKHTMVKQGAIVQSAYVL